MERKPAITNLVVIVLGLTFGLAVGSQVLNTQMSAGRVILGGVLLALAGAGLAYFVVLQHTWPRLMRFSRRTQLVWITVCLLAGFWLVVVIPLNVYPLVNEVQITATGSKNPQSKGSEVWLAKVIAGDRAPRDRLSEFCRGDWATHWEGSDALLVSFQYQPSQLTCYIKTDENIVIQFGMHAWSGKVKLVYGGQTVREDLYSENSQIKTITFSVGLSTGQRIARSFLFLVDALWLGIFLLVTSVFFVTLERTQGGVVGGKSPAWYVYALPMGLVWLVYLLAFWPGLASPDTFTQWGQIVTGHFKNWHPAFHTWLLWLITRLWFSLTAIVLVQILAISAVLGWGLSVIRRLGAPAWLPWLILALLILSPANGLAAIIPWKDIPYSLSVIALTILILQVVASNGSALDRPYFWIGMGIVGAFTMLFRHNGWPVTVCTLVALILLYRRQRFNLFAALAIALGLWWVVTGLLFRVAKVDTQPVTAGKNASLEASLFYLAIWHYRAGTPFSPAEGDLYQQIRPIFDDVLTADWSPLTENSIPVARMVFNLTLRNPGVTFNFLMQKASYIFQIFSPPFVRIEHVPIEIMDNSYGLAVNPKLPQAHDLLIRLIAITERPKIEWFFWRNAFWMYLLIFAACVASMRTRNWKYMLVTLPVLLNAMPLVLLSGGHIYRYIIPTIWAGLLLSGFFLLIPCKE